MSESAEWHPNVHRVVDAAKALGLEIEPRNFGNAKTDRKSTRLNSSH